ncbi:hypothetical protein [Agromyces ramosus]|uniref:Uncharacterized protein n=1 Tax=Agromyces ramosus TaxID=33879 RepID=A0ABU0R9V8_9MICO|nr:hypothetical protein [Agromyces ramosus]MDQ0894858.1 hypothetical protein [Agromyces ramosus]
MADPLEVVEVTVEATFPLRRRVLRSDRVDLDRGCRTMLLTARSIWPFRRGR